MEKKKINPLVIVGIVLVGVVVILISTYNGLITAKEDVSNKFANIDTQLQRRADLVPNLVNSVKGYVKHEEVVIEAITDARKNLVNAKSVDEKSKANDELSNAIDNLMVIVEGYPDLKASTNFIQLSDELAGTENRISVARKDFNTAVKSYNTKLIKFPTNILASMFGFEKESYFEASESAKEVPNVSFE